MTTLRKNPWDKARPGLVAEAYQALDEQRRELDAIADVLNWSDGDEPSRAWLETTRGRLHTIGRDLNTHIELIYQCMGEYIATVSIHQAIQTRLASRMKVSEREELATHGGRAK